MRGVLFKVRVITRQHFVGALAIKQHSDVVLARESHHAPLSVNTRRTERLFLVPEHFRQLIEELLRRGPYIRSLNAVFASHEIDPLTFVTRRFVKARGKSLLNSFRWKQTIDDGNDRA